MGEKAIYVYDGFGAAKPELLGMLYVNVIRGSESYSFEYNSEWLKKKKSFIFLDPDLQSFSCRQYPTSKKIFGLFSDASPDRWGRILMEKRERYIADKESRKPRKLYDSDYLLGVFDETRMGGLRFKLNPNDSFVANDPTLAIPPWTKLRSLENASRNFEDGKFEYKWLTQLVQPGSSLGGARPKATVTDEKGDLWIAKFPSKNDEYDSGAWEKVMHDLAQMCGLCVPEARLEKFSRLGSTYLVKRFDRDGQKRIHYASAMTLLGKADGDFDGTSYLDIAAFIKANGATPKIDLVELWKRIVFYMSVTNTDDHLRNHSFLLTPSGWKLSPLYDVNPVPYGEELSLNVNEIDNRIDIDLAISTAEYFNIKKVEAIKIAKEIIRTVNDNWMLVASKIGLPKNQMEIMCPAFGLKI